MEGVEIDFREDGLQAVAERVMERKTGARGLRSILRDLLESMYHSIDFDVAKIVVDESVAKAIQNHSWSTRLPVLPRRCGRLVTRAALGGSINPF